MWSFRLAAVLAASVYSIGAGEFMLAPMLTPLAEAFGATPAAMSWLIASHAFAYAVAAPLIGLAGQNRPRRLLILAALLLFALDAAALPLAPSFAIALLLRILGGIAAAALIAPVFALIADLVPPERQTGAMSGVMLGMTAGIVSGPAFAGLLASAFDWRAPFFALSALSVAVFTAGILCLPGGTPREATTRLAFRCLRQPALLRPLLAKAIWLSAAVAAYLMSGEILRQRFALGTEGIGLMASLFGMGLGLGNLAAQPAQILWKGIDKALLFALFLIAAMIAAFLLQAGLIITLVSLCLCGLGLGMAAPLSTALLAQRSGALPGPVLAFSESANNLALMAILPVAARFAVPQQPAMVLWLLGLMAGGIGLTLLDRYLSVARPVAAYPGRGLPPASPCSPARPPDNHR